MSSEFAYVLKCPACRKEEYLGLPQALKRLASLGMLKRQQSPAHELVLELLQNTLGQFSCSACGATGLTLEEDASWDEQLHGRRLCQQCATPIDPDRLEVFPDTELCVACQLGEESGNVSDEVDYCPHCGTPMKVQPRRGALTRYQLVCPACPRRGR